jgi:hypothetical protein
LARRADKNPLALGDPIRARSNGQSGLKSFPARLICNVTVIFSSFKETIMADPQLIQEKLKLDQEFAAYVKEHGFDYAQYCAPPAGSWYESYRQRVKAIEDKLLTKLEYWKPKD